jgi:Fe-S-cluster-containing hydrogenase component 2
MGALFIADEVAVVNLDRCIGCGVCTTACVSDALRLRKKERQHVPPKTQSDLYKNIMVERFGLLGTLKTVARVLSGRKA